MQVEKRVKLFINQEKYEALNSEDRFDFIVVYYVSVKYTNKENVLFYFFFFY